ncbi:atrophin-1-like isoform X2 [Mya arenaria]|uniref:atrophin-1-like isoform X2 n=1 Tax=Mya arenaria TaxID=6604 RepID=UPI0022E3BC2D|nr:atrophin-1-like isoform X2 [Mya arenaria]
MDKVVFLLALIALVRCQVPPSTSEAPLPVSGNASDNAAGSVVSTPQTPIPDPPLPSPTPVVDPSPPKSPEIAARTAADLAALGLGGTNQPWNLFNKQAPYDLTQIARNLPPTPQVNMFGLPSGGAFGGQQSSPNMFGLGTGSGSGNNMLQMMMLLQRLGAGAAAAADAPDPPNPTSPSTGNIRGFRGGFPGAFQGASPGVQKRFHPRGAAPPVRSRQAGAGTGVEAGEAAEGVTPAAGAGGSEFNAIDNLIAMEEQRQRRNRMKAQARMSLPMHRRPGGGNPFAGQPSGGPYPNYPNNAGPNPYQNQGPYRDTQGPYAGGQWQYQSSSSQGSQPNAYTYPTEPPMARRPPPPPRGEPANIPYPQLSSPAAKTQTSWNYPPSQGSPQMKHPGVLDRRNSAYTTAKPLSANQGQVSEPVEVERQGQRKQAGGTSPKPTPMIPKSKPTSELSNIPPIPDPNVPNLPSPKTTAIPSQTDTWSQSPDPNAQTAIGTPVDSWPQSPNPSRDQPYRDAWAQASSQSWGADPSGLMPQSDRARGRSNTDPWTQGPDGRWGSAARQDVPPRDQGWGRGSSAPQQSWQDQQWSQFNSQQYPQDLGRSSSSYPPSSQPLNIFPSPPHRPTPNYPNPGQVRNQIQSNFHKMFLGAGADPVAARNMRIKRPTPSANTATGTEAANAADLQADQADMMADQLDNMQSVNPMQTMMQGVADPSLMGGFSGMGGNAFGGANAGMGMQGAASGGGMGDSMMRMALLSRLLGGETSGIGGGAGATSGFGMNPMLAMMAGGAGM